MSEMDRIPTHIEGLDEKMQEASHKATSASSLAPREP